MAVYVVTRSVVLYDCHLHGCCSVSWRAVRACVSVARRVPSMTTIAHVTQHLVGVVADVLTRVCLFVCLFVLYSRTAVSRHGRTSSPHQAEHRDAAVEQRVWMHRVAVRCATTAVCTCYHCSLLRTHPCCSRLNRSHAATMCDRSDLLGVSRSPFHYYVPLHFPPRCSHPLFAFANAYGDARYNEIWPTGGWGSIEYGTVGYTKGQVLGGRWKPLQHW